MLLRPILSWLTNFQVWIFNKAKFRVTIKLSAVEWKLERAGYGTFTLVEYVGGLPPQRCGPHDMVTINKYIDIRREQVTNSLTTEYSAATVGRY